MNMNSPAMISSGKSFMTGAGRWAGEQLAKALKEGRPLSPAALRTADTLRNEEWVYFDRQIIEGAVPRIRGIADLRRFGLVTPIANSMGKTVIQWETVGDMDPASVSMDGMVRTENDRPDFSFAQAPLPITHKDFFINLRTLSASRQSGEALDARGARVAGRKCAEASEDMLFNGGKTFGGLTIYGYRTHPNRSTGTFITNGAWHLTAKTGADIIADINLMISALNTNGFFGPFIIYIAPGAELKMAEDYKANGDKTIRQRILDNSAISDIVVTDTMPAGNVVMVQMTEDNVTLLDGEPLQTVQWDVEGGMGINFKAFQIEVPLITANSLSKVGVYHMS